jgi:hypothetical protein
MVAMAFTSEVGASRVPASDSLPVGDTKRFAAEAVEANTRETRNRGATRIDHS